MSTALLIFGVIGVMSIVVAASVNYYRNFEAEDGSRSGDVSIETDASASNGNMIKFGQASAGCISTESDGYPIPDLTGHANSCNTGPRYVCTDNQGAFTTTYDGQVIDRVCINGSLEIRNNNVTVRDVKIMGTGTYPLDIGQGMAECPTNLRVEHTEIDMVNASNIDWGVYQRCAGGHTFDHFNYITSVEA